MTQINLVRMSDIDSQLDLSSGGVYNPSVTPPTAQVVRKSAASVTRSSTRRAAPSST
ncbi:hypothetical protein ACFQDE_17155 [Deinococcus caeni]|uniref:hypothetical protein n=1 Tax=Deinococcus caeni TaxID=569127 RepID=UPI0036068224